METASYLNQTKPIHFEMVNQRDMDDVRKSEELLSQTFATHSDAIYLEQLSRTLIELTNRIPPDHPFLTRYLAAGFASQGEKGHLSHRDIWPRPTFTKDTTHEPPRALCPSLAEESSIEPVLDPKFRLVVLSATAELSEQVDYATVWLTTRCNRSRFNFEREGVMAMYWRKVWRNGEKVWVCQRNKVIKYGGVDVLSS